MVLWCCWIMERSLKFHTLNIIFFLYFTKRYQNIESSFFMIFLSIVLYKRFGKSGAVLLLSTEKYLIDSFYQLGKARGGKLIEKKNKYISGNQY